MAGRAHASSTTRLLPPPPSAPLRLLLQLLLASALEASAAGSSSSSSSVGAPGPAVAASISCEPCECSLTDHGLRADCEGRRVTDVPASLPENVTTLRLSGTSVSVIRSNALRRYRQLTDLIIQGDEALREVQSGAFDNNVDLTAVVITLCPNLTRIQEGVFTRFHRLRFITLERNGLLEVPDFSAFENHESIPAHIDLDHNKITRIRGRSWCRQRSAVGPCSPVHYAIVSMRDNKLEEIEAFSFAGVTIMLLDFSLNPKLSKIDENAFANCSSLRNLSLSGTSISRLPVAGLEELVALNIESTPTLTRLPPTVSYIKVTEVRVSYPQHCCAFKYPKIQDAEVYEEVKRLLRERHGCLSPTLRSTAALPPPAGLDSAEAPPDSWATDYSGTWSSGEIFQKRHLLALGSGIARGSFGEIFPDLKGDSANTQKPVAERTQDSGGIWLPEGAVLPGSQDKQRTVDPCSEEGWNLDLFRELNLQCTPAPNAFNPCVDVLEADWLRALLWIVALLTLAGNASVLSFTACTRGTTAAPLTVGKFLVAHLAVADLALVSHLMALAGEDAATRGEYFNHALGWQQGGWCDAMGFLAVFGAELSVFTLCAITLERWYAISHAINLTKRMRMRHAVVIMAAGWVLCAAIAAAPLFNISSYQVTSMCLPFRYDTMTDKAYIIFLLIVNVGAFVLVLFCYVSMFLQVRGSDAWSSGDAYIAKRMALLVFTDFVCWGPVAIVAALSAGGIDVSLSSFSLSQLTHAKIVLAVFYPFNACANPFLYALLTKQFRKDVVTAMGRFGLCRWKLRYVVESLATSHSSSPWHLPGSRGSRRGRGTATHPSAGSLTTQCTLAGLPCSQQPCIHVTGKLHYGAGGGFGDDMSADSPGADSGDRCYVADWPAMAAVAASGGEAEGGLHMQLRWSGSAAAAAMNAGCDCGRQCCPHPPLCSSARTPAAGQQQQQGAHTEQRQAAGRGQSEQHPLLELRLSGGSSRIVASGVVAPPLVDAPLQPVIVRRSSSRRRPTAEHQQQQQQAALRCAAAVAASMAEGRCLDRRHYRSIAADIPPRSSQSDSSFDTSPPPPSSEAAVMSGHSKQHSQLASALSARTLPESASPEAATVVSLSGSSLDDRTNEPDAFEAERKRSQAAPGGEQGARRAMVTANRESGFYSLERPPTADSSPLLGRSATDDSFGGAVVGGASPTSQRHELATSNSDGSVAAAAVTVLQQATDKSLSGSSSSGS